MRMLKFVPAVLLSTVLCSVVSFGQDAMTPEIKAKIEAKLKLYAKLGSDSFIVASVREANANPPAEGKGMTQEKWTALTVLSPEVKAFTKNALAQYLKTKKGDEVSEAFVSCADGTKVAFLSKTTNWCHKGKPKHDIPMTGKTWIGKVEVDQSTGVQAVQISFPVLDNGKPIGSIVFGLAVSKL